MITMMTGLPGSGKTLFMINYIEAMRAKEPHRTVYYSGIRDLTLPWVNIGGFEKDPETGVTAEVIPADAPVKGGGEWFKVAAGGIVVIDECQNYFRPRGNGAAVPQMVKEFETHRHRGLDIILITQHPLIIDSNVRRLVERHYHAKRWFGLAGANVHEFQGVKTDCEKSTKGGILHKFKYPKASYGWYKSAEVHTVKSRVPARVWFLALVPVLLVAFGWVLYTVMWPYVTPEGARQRIQGKGVQDKAPGRSGAPVGGPEGARTSQPAPEHKMTVAEYVADFRPRVGGMPHTAPVFDPVLRPVVAPTPSACVAEGDRCSCYTEQATAIDIDLAVCQQIVKRGFFQYWRKPAEGQGQQVKVSEPVPASARPVADRPPEMLGSTVAQADTREPEPSPPVFVRVPDTSQWRFKQ